MGHSVKIGSFVAMVVAVMLTLSVSACGQPKSASEANAAESKEEASGFVWTVDADCSMCHTAQAASASDAACQLYNGHADATCVSCHTDAAGLEEAHAEVGSDSSAASAKLDKTEVAADACLACHESDYTPAATADVTALTDKNGTMVNPHDLPVNTQHEDIVCGDCHDMHSTSTVEEAAYSTCLSCHHMEIFECNTCH
ncbi:MAG: hypothetical protein HGA54_00325 [Actinobacteria bacterium]|nr:hypothetical protein [Actinomycetota bacterium]